LPLAGTRGVGVMFVGPTLQRWEDDREMLSPVGTLQNSF
jgi:hypothetical protein